MSGRIGLLVIDIEGGYSEMIWSYAAKEIEGSEYDLLILPAHNPEFPFRYSHQYNVLFNFINKKNMDVLIFIPAVLGNFISPEKTDELIKRIKKEVPVVSLNSLIDGSPSLLIKNKKGIEKCVQHLVDHHQYRTIGFISGPEKDNDAMERKEAFLSAMKSLDGKVEKYEVFPGDFTTESGQEVIRQGGIELVKEFDAILCANDYMALGLVGAIRELGYDVPRDMAVIGFDNIAETVFHNPPITSVKQPFSDMIAKSVSLAKDICEGREVPGEIHFDLELMVRSSCGCTHFLCDKIYNKPIIMGDLDPEQLVAFMMTELMLPPRIETRVLELLDFLMTNEPIEDNIYHLLIIFESIINHELNDFNSFPDWQKIFSMIMEVYSILDNKTSGHWKEKGLYEKSMLLIGKKEKLWISYNEAQRMAHFTRPLRTLREELATVLTTEEFVGKFVDSFHLLDMKNCYLTLLKKGAKERGLYSTLQSESELLVAFRDGKYLSPAEDKNHKNFRTLQIIPESIKTKPSGLSSFLVPLFYKERLFGFLISDCRKYSGAILESLRHEISVILHSCYLNEERLSAENKLREILEELEQNNLQLKKDSMNDGMTGLLNRKGFLAEVNSKIQLYSSGKVQFALFFADMDGLKRINDTHGHSTGDKAIRDMSIILKDIFREEDTIARLGGDEFTVFALDVPENFPGIVQRRLRKLLSRYNRDNPHNPFILSISFGHKTGYTNDPHVDLSVLMEEADKELYLEKKRKKHTAKE